MEIYPSPDLKVYEIVFLYKIALKAFIKHIEVQSIEHSDDLHQVDPQNMVIISERYNPLLI